MVDVWAAAKPSLRGLWRGRLCPKVAESAALSALIGEGRVVVLDFDAVSLWVVEIVKRAVSYGCVDFVVEANDVCDGIVVGQRFDLCDQVVGRDSGRIVDVSITEVANAVSVRGHLNLVYAIEDSFGWVDGERISVTPEAVLKVINFALVVSTEQVQCFFGVMTCAVRIDFVYLVATEIKDGASAF